MDIVRLVSIGVLYMSRKIHPKANVKFPMVYFPEAAFDLLIYQGYNCGKLVSVVVALRASTKEFPLGNHWDKQGWTDAAVDTTTIRHPTS